MDVIQVVLMRIICAEHHRDGGGAFLRPATARLRTDLDQRRTSLARCWSRIYQRLKERAHRGAALPHHRV